MYWFGKRVDHHFNWQDVDAWKNIDINKRKLAVNPIEEIIQLLDAFSEESFDDALPELVNESGFSVEETKKTLDLLPVLLKRENLEKRLRGEFTKIEALDQFIKLPHGRAKVKAIPRGILLHITAGNVFLSSVDSLIMGFLTKNLSILKVSSKNKFFPLYFSQKLQYFDKQSILGDKFSILYWKGGDEEKENYLKHKVDTILAWGGEEMVSSYRKNLPLSVKLIEFGPKISFQVLSKKGLVGKNLKIVAEKVVADIIPWDQGACASPQNLYLEAGIEEETLLLALHEAFIKSPPRGRIDEDEATEILKEKYRAYYSELMESGICLSGTEHLIHLEKNSFLKSSPLHRSLIVKKFSSLSELGAALSPFSYYLQSCSYLLDESEKDSFLEELSFAGVKRFSPLGTITWGREGAPHDGKFVLRELVSFISDEVRFQGYGEELFCTTDSETIKNSFETTSHPRGYIFSSGGTTGSPKFLHFSYEEFDYMTDMLAENFRYQGIKPGMVVANLFVAGNLWSSFIAVEKAMEKIGAIQLPIGGLCSQENIFYYLKKFKPHAVLGIPSLLMMTAQFCVQMKENLNIPMIFYAGEALSPIRKEYLSEVWGSTYFGSAGYASVDAGVIGYQCPTCGPGEHHVFSDLIDLKIIDTEIVVSSIIRSSMPVKNYRTGDRGEWIGPGQCLTTDPRFKLLGRTDSVINIWSSRILLSDLESLLSEVNVMTFQVRLFEEKKNDFIHEKMVISLEVEEESLDKKKLVSNLFHRSRDVRDTLSFESFEQNVSFVFLKSGTLPRHPRTGKIPLVVDERHLST